MTAEPRCWGGGVSHPSQLTTGLVIKSVTTSPTLAGERMLFILQVSILSEQILIIRPSTDKGTSLTIEGSSVAEADKIGFCFYSYITAKL